MATYTPNYNLGKPEPSDPFGNFRQLFNDNMDEIDANLGGGGGGGGHTIVDENGSDMPAESKLQFTGNVSVTDDNVNGATVVDVLGGGGNVYGAFLDPSRVVYSAFTFDGSTHSWTATEDCILTDNMTPPDGSTAYFIRIDGKQVFAGYSTVEDPFVYVKKGQVVEYRAKSGSTMKAYGITQGTSGIYAPVIYSDNERVIGVWRDNKPLYQKTVVLTSGFSTNMTVTHGISNLERVVYVQGTLNNDIIPFTAMENNTFMGQWSSSITGMNASNFKIYIGSDLVQYVSQIAVTLRYTKTTDVAGSGNWNTDGVPTHHYSTSEQVVGTWIDGKPLYEKTIDGGMIIAGANWNTFPHGVTDMDVCTSIEAILVNSTGTNILNAYRPSLDLGVVIERNGANMRYMNTWFGNNEAQIIATIRYTKTTD